VTHIMLKVGNGVFMTKEGSSETARRGRQDRE
jgi:hypothetical protein